MIRALHKSWAETLWDLYLPFLWRKHFRSLELPSFPETAAEASLLVLPNHISWWDGFIWYLVNKRAIRKRFHILMLEETLQKNFFFRYLGGFSIRKGHRSMVETLRYVEELLADPQNMVVIFPQGKIQSQLEQYPELEAGMLRLIDSCPRARVLMARVYTDYESFRKPALYVKAEMFQGKAADFPAAFRQLLSR